MKFIIALFIHTVTIFLYVTYLHIYKTNQTPSRVREMGGWRLVFCRQMNSRSPFNGQRRLCLALCSMLTLRFLWNFLWEKTKQVSQPSALKTSLTAQYSAECLEIPKTIVSRNSAEYLGITPTVFQILLLSWGGICHFDSIFDLVLENFLPITFLFKYFLFKSS
jgi:hypothetical protein